MRDHKVGDHGAGVKNGRPGVAAATGIIRRRARATFSMAIDGATPTQFRVNRQPPGQLRSEPGTRADVKDRSGFPKLNRCEQTEDMGSNQGTATRS
jgi:hypothetical protein